MQLILDNIKGSGPLYLAVLKAICGDTKDKSMVDLCCCYAPHTPTLGFKKRTYVDVIHRKMDHPAEQERFVQADAIEFLDTTVFVYDVAICSDGIEHFTREKGMELIKAMEWSSDKQIFFTPLGRYLVDEEDTNPENHHSGWLPSDVPGYASIVFPHYHERLGVGAFFFWKCEDIMEDFFRVVNLLKNTICTEAKQLK